MLVGDVVRLAPGDQVVADGELVEAQHLALDESILTGESVTVERGVGESVRSGSFAVEGAAAFVVSAVGADSYAERLAGEARRFRHAHSPLERALNRLLLVLVGAMVPLGVMLGYALYHRHVSTRAAISTATAGVVTLVPEGLILLTSLTFAVAALKMARRGALAQQLNAVESLASADVVCLDKTGTLTMAELRVVEAVPDSIGGLLGRFAASSPSRNTTLAAIAAAFPAEAEPLEGSVPFSSSRRWSGLQLDGEAYVLGAPDLLSLDGLRRPCGCGGGAGPPRAGSRAGEGAAGGGLGADCPRAARAGRPRRAAPAGDAGDGRVLQPRGHLAARALGRRARDGGGDRGRRGHSVGRAAARRRRAAGRSGGAARGARGDRGRRDASRPRGSGSSSRLCAAAAGTSRWSATASTTSRP